MNGTVFVNSFSHHIKTTHINISCDDVCLFTLFLAKKNRNCHLSQCVANHSLPLYVRTRFKRLEQYANEDLFGTSVFTSTVLLDVWVNV